MQEYDFIASLGGNCSVAAQLKRRNLRRYALPFDYFFFKTEDEFDKITNAFKNDFKNCFLKENLVELVGTEKGTSVQFQYKDLISGYRIIHLFREDLNDNGVYEKYSSILFRRLKRFYEKLSSAQKVCFVLTMYADLDYSKYLQLYNVFKEKYPDKEIRLIIKVFGANEELIDQITDGLEVHKHIRNVHDYDYFQTAIEWRFLDYISLRTSNKRERYFYKFLKEKRGCKLALLGYFNRMIQFRIYIFGYSFEFSLGRFKEFS